MNGPRQIQFRSSGLSPSSKPSRGRWTWLIAAVLALAACAGAPTQEMSDARQAVSAARQARAEAEVTSTFELAVRHLDDASQALEQGDYDTARVEALAARSTALKARRMAEALSTARHAIDQARDAGRDTSRAEERLLSAQLAAGRGDEARATRLAGEAAQAAGTTH